MNGPDRFEERLARVLAASHAPADPAVLARALQRAAAGRPVPGPLSWLATPAALAATAALLVVVTVGGTWIVRADSASSRETSLVSALIGDDGSYGLPAAGANAPTANGDSGGVTP
jgi:hypothetical protein